MADSRHYNNINNNNSNDVTFVQIANVGAPRDFVVAAPAVALNILIKEIITLNAFPT